MSRRFDVLLYLSFCQRFALSFTVVLVLFCFVFCVITWRYLPVSIFTYCAAFYIYLIDNLCEFQPLLEYIYKVFSPNISISLARTIYHYIQ
jgi:hypothetical protein